MGTRNIEFEEQKNYTDTICAVNTDMQLINVSLLKINVVSKSSKVKVEHVVRQRRTEFQWEDHLDII